MSKRNTFINDYKTKLIGLFSILFFLWFIIYAIPSIFISLFHTLLGNIILLISILLVGSIYSSFYGVGLAIIIIILYQISHPYHLFTNGKEVKESFWSPQSIDTFLKIQNTINPQSNFDTSVIQQQASQKEVDYFIKKGFWPWSKEVEDLFIEKTNKNTYIRSYPPDAMIHAKTIYNENAIKQVLADKTLDRGIIINSVEPDLSGHGDFGYTSGLVTNETNPKSTIIRKNYKSTHI